jgi:Na+/glutamate symporter
VTVQSNGNDAVRKLYFFKKLAIPQSTPIGIIILLNGIKYFEPIKILTTKITIQNKIEKQNNLKLILQHYIRDV